MHSKTRSLGPMIRLNIDTVFAARARILALLAFFLGLGLFASGIDGVRLSSILYLSLGATLVIKLFFLEDKTNLNLFYEELPTTRRTVVSARYLLSACIVPATAIAMIPSWLVAVRFTDYGPTKELFFAIAYLLIEAIVIAAIIPIYTAFGPQNQVLILISLMSVLLILGGAFAGLAWLFWEPTTWLIQRPPLFGLVGLIIVAALWAISWLISIKIYERKDF